MRSVFETIAPTAHGLLDKIKTFWWHFKTIFPWTCLNLCSVLELLTRRPIINVRSPKETCKITLIQINPSLVNSRTQ